MKRFVPHYYSKDIFSLSESFLLEQGIRYVISDLDNTLDGHDVRQPSPRVYALKQRLEQKGIHLFLVSNNASSRVTAYAEALGVQYLSSAHKPFKKRMLNFLKEHQIPFNQVVLIGDQLLTDVLCAKACDIRVILTEPIVKEDQWTTKFNRFIDRPIRSHLRRKGYLSAREVPYESRN